MFRCDIQQIVMHNGQRNVYIYIHIWVIFITCKYTYYVYTPKTVRILHTYIRTQTHKHKHRHIQIHTYTHKHKPYTSDVRIGHLSQVDTLPPPSSYPIFPKLTQKLQNVYIYKSKSSPFAITIQTHHVYIRLTIEDIKIPTHFVKYKHPLLSGPGCPQSVRRYTVHAEFIYVLSRSQR